MATNWTTVAGSDLNNVAALSLVLNSNENTAEGTEPGSELDLGLANRRDFWAAQAVIHFRSCVKKGGRMPLSVEEDCVSPDAVPHVLVWAAWRLLNSSPGTDRGPMSALLNDPSTSDLRRQYDEAVKYFECVTQGDNVELPSDPTGVDYVTEVSGDNPAINGVKWADGVATDEEYSAGVTERNQVVNLGQNDMNTY